DSADHKVAMEQTIEKDGREIILNSGCGWSFTATQAQAQNRDLKERARSLLGIDLDRYIGKGIDVQSYDTLIRGQGSWDSKRTYLFVFVGDELLYQEDFEGTEHFSAVVELCTQLMQ
ncbi:MAG: hypothetical protein FWE65_03420, partial [Eggerthellaceae bacterium]|nr:hypothetical protein [Eggerthellaceae bacterium]